MDKKKLQLKNVSGNEAIEKDIEGIINIIKDDKIKNGVIPKTPSISIMKFAGKTLRIDKSVYLNGNQYFVKQGTVWEDIDAFARKHISFSNEDFE